MTARGHRALRWVLYCALFALIPLSLIALFHASTGESSPAVVVLERGDLLLVAASIAAAAFAEYSATPLGWREVGIELSKWLALATAVFSAGAYVVEMTTTAPLPLAVPISLVCYGAALIAGLTAILLSEAKP